MRNIIIGALIAAVAVPAFAADASAARKGDMLRDANNARLGTVDSVKPDGSVGIIYASHYVIVPAATLSTVGGKLMTKLTKADISALK